VARRANVGGFLHLLLPEATGTDVSFNSESHATTGMLFFLKKLTDAGALKERLEACVGGDALIRLVMELYR